MIIPVHIPIIFLILLELISYSLLSERQFYSITIIILNIYEYQKARDHMLL